MKTNFDKITENVDTLVKAMVADVRCKSCIYGQEKRIGDQVEYDCFFDSDVCYIGKETCIEGVKEWLKQPLPLDEQFTDEEIGLAKMAKANGSEYLCRPQNANFVLLYSKKPTKEFDPRKGKGWYWAGVPFDEMLNFGFKYITYKDGLVKLDDIINSKGDKK